jgi:ABC-type transport system involved in multi-copper enzyme maturation permease subunit
MMDGLMGHIFRREVLDQLTSFKFFAGLLLVLLLFGLNGLVFSLRYKNEVVEYRQVLHAWEEGLSARKTLDDLPRQAFDSLKIPLKTAFLASGGQYRLPNDYRFTINIWGSRPETLRAFSQNALVESFQALDWSFLVGTAFALLALVFAYDSISGEKARGTLKLLQTYNLSRSSILFGKLLANLAVLLVLLVAGMLFSLLWLLLAGQIDLGSGDWARLALFLLLSAFYIALFLCLGLWLSALTERPTASMVLAVMVWVVSIVVIPGVGTLLIQRVRKIPTENEVGGKADRIYDQISKEFNNHDSVWRGREMAKGDNFEFEKVSTVAQNKRKHLQEEIWDDYLRQKFAQARTVRDISSLSPSGLFEYGAESVNGTGVLADESLVEQAHQYRASVEEWIRQRDLVDTESPHLCFQPGYLSLKPFQASSLPRFEYRPPSVWAGVRDALWRISLLSAETLVMLFASVIAFQRYDVR